MTFDDFLIDSPGVEYVMRHKSKQNQFNVIFSVKDIPDMNGNQVVEIQFDGDSELHKIDDARKEWNNWIRKGYRPIKDYSDGT